MGNAHSDSRNPTANGTGALVDGLGPVVQIVNLAAPLHLPTDGIIDNGGVVFGDKGLNGITVGGRFLNGGHIPNAGKGHVQRPGDGGGGKGQHIHALGDFFQPLLVTDAEALLFVHNQQPQILELNALLQQLVGADDQIHIAASQVLDGFALLLGGAEPAEHIDVDRKAPEAGYGGLIMLLGQNRGGHQNGSLLAVHHAFHHSPKGYLGFSKAHIAAEKPVHGGWALHVMLDVRNAAQLVVGFRVGEIVLELFLPGSVRRKSIAGLALPGGVELNQLPGHVLCCLSGLRFCLLPCVGADFVQLHIGVLSAASDVFAHQVQLGGGDEQGIGALIGNFDIVLDGPVHLDLLHGHKAANAVVLVDHQITGG